MSSKTISISASEELFEAIENLREVRDADRSSVVETLLREHPLVQRELDPTEPHAGLPGTSKVRDADEIDALARVARRQWAKREETGEVAFLDR